MYLSHRPSTPSNKPLTTSQFTPAYPLNNNIRQSLTYRSQEGRNNYERETINVNQLESIERSLNKPNEMRKTTIEK